MQTYCTRDSSQGTDLHMNDKFSEATRREDRRLAKDRIGVRPSSLLCWLNDPNIFYKRKMVLVLVVVLRLCGY